MAAGRQPGGFKDDVELANAAYGQAETFVTPLQMALVAATVANDGELMRPRLVTAMTGQRSGTQGDRSAVDGPGHLAGRRPGDHDRDGPGRRGTARTAVHGRRQGPGRDHGRQVGHGRAGWDRRASLVVHRLRPGRGADHRHRRHRRAGRPRRRGRGTDRRRPHVAAISRGPGDGPRRGRRRARLRRAGLRPTARTPLVPTARPVRSSSGSGWPRWPSSSPRCSAGWPPHRGSVASRSSRSWPGWAA